ncbi:MAG: T9SS type A sorting domain-containing protein [Candidatus Electryonea clarkiae]|nr:T9SS type A sorting domain-containing protein [Candidatus Electryonea clarkiae]MDP8287209.1 T9SS type A sorting domain-containing protein [Candidatus Electryonea clarkiae]
MGSQGKTGINYLETDNDNGLNFVYPTIGCSKYTTPMMDGGYNNIISENGIINYPLYIGLGDTVDVPTDETLWRFQYNYWGVETIPHPYPYTINNTTEDGLIILGLDQEEDLEFYASSPYPYDVLPYLDEPYQPPDGFKDWAPGFTEAPTYRPGYVPEEEIGPADDALDDCNFYTAGNLYMTHAQNHEDLDTRLEAVNGVIKCQNAIGLDSTDYRTKLETLADTTKYPVLEFRAETAIAVINGYCGNFEDAIEYFEDVITDPDCIEDSIMAVLNAGLVYMNAAREETTSVFDPNFIARLDSVELLGDISSLKPYSRTQHDSLTRALREVQREVFLPTFEPASYTISDSVIWTKPFLHLKNDLTITSTGYLKLPLLTVVLGNDVSIIVEGELNAVGIDTYYVFFAPYNTDSTGVKIELESGSSDSTKIQHCYFINSTRAIEQNLTLEYPISGCIFKNCEEGIYANTGGTIEVVIASCRFESDGTFTDEPIHLYSSASGSDIVNCEFIGAMLPIYASSGDLSVIDCYFDNEDTLETASEAPAIEFRNMTGEIIHNTIYRYPTGILLYDSDVALEENKIEECFQEGLWLINDSYPDMTDAGSGAYNWLKFNGADHDTTIAQIRIAGNIYPHMKSGLNNVWEAEDGYAIVSASAPSSEVKLTYNYWGTAGPNIDSLFYPNSQYFVIAPFETSEQTPQGGYRTLSDYDDLLDEALQQIEDGELDEAIENLEDVILEDSSTHNRVGAISMLTDCWLGTENNRNTLITFLENIADTTVSERIAHEALHGKAQVNVELGNYEDATDFYEDVIVDQNSTFEDSICAVIDAANIYLLANGMYDLLSVPGEDEGNERSQKGSDRQSAGLSQIKELKPNSYRRYIRDSHRLFSQLRHTAASGQYDNILPREFALHQNYPNPFNPVTAIKFDLPDKAHVNLLVTNILGQRVYTLIDRQMNAGFHHISLDMSDVASGLYFYTIKAGNHVETKKMVLLK